MEPLTIALDKLQGKIMLSWICSSNYYYNKTQKNGTESFGLLCIIIKGYYKRSRKTLGTHLFLI